MKRISIAFAGGLNRPPGRGRRRQASGGLDVLSLLIKATLEKFYAVEVSDSPDYVFLSQDPKSQAALFSRYASAPVRIFTAGEAIVPDFNLCDYAIGFDPMTFRDRYFQMHPVVFYKKYFKYGRLERESGRDVPASKDRFCNFVYSNPKAHPARDRFFHLLNQYKRVDSAGRHLNNYGDELVGVEDPMAAKMEFQRRYKFSIVFENALHAGYTTEKLLQSMIVDSIPIYWGNPAVGEMFNTRAFVNVHEFDTLEEAVTRVEEIDRDDVLYRRIAAERWWTESQERAGRDGQQRLEAFLRNVFDQPLSRARRRAEGHWQSKYERSLRRRLKLDRSLAGRAYAEWDRARGRKLEGAP